MTQQHPTSHKKCDDCYSTHLPEVHPTSQGEHLKRLTKTAWQIRNADNPVVAIDNLVSFVYSTMQRNSDIITHYTPKTVEQFNDLAILICCGKDNPTNDKPCLDSNLCEDCQRKVDAISRHYKAKEAVRAAIGEIPDDRRYSGEMYEVYRERVLISEALNLDSGTETKQ